MSRGIIVQCRSLGERDVLQRFLTMPGMVKERIQIALEYLGGEMVGRMRAHEAGLKRRTGKLERSFYHKVFVRDGGETFVLRAGVSRRAFYAAFQDPGVKRKQVDVRSYTRSSKIGNIRAGRRLIAQGVGFVSAYKRQEYVPPHPFIWITYEEMRAQIVAELDAAVRGVVLGS